MKNFRDLDTLTIYLNISKIRLLDQIKLCRNASIEMDPSKNNRFSAEEAMNYIPHTKKKKKVPICEMLEYFQTLLSYMLSTLLHALKFIIEIEDNGMACDYYVTKVGAVLSIRNAFQALYCHKEFHDILYGDPMSASVYFFIFCTEHHKKIKI